MDTVVVNSLLALIVAFGVAALLGPIVIPILHRLKFGQNVRDDGPKTHLKKQNTPTMGGVMILAAIVIATLIFSNRSYSLTLWALLFTVLFGLVGFLDDFIKIVKKRSLGLRAWQKIAAQFVLSLGFAIALYFHPMVGSTIWLLKLDLGIFFIPFAMFVIIGTVNSVNLIDGLDGLSSSVTSVYSLAMGVLVILYVLSYPTASLEGESAVAAAGLLDGLSGIAVFAFAVAGGCLGFLVYNSYPAKVFMGDLGAFTLGGAVAAMALLTRTTLLLPLMGIMYVASSVSVILQVGSYKLRHKRIFRMAPLHHHFELGGAPETRIVSMYSIVTAIASACALLIFWFCK
ncbi:MAG: phospho-N-acetylmuramoyl-pentapeptide-transferase [Clostridia bacterium]|nr:phospho-N-acetylmuramoyl-pentapeptide-transferase [Clostridia bacterium]